MIIKLITIHEGIFAYILDVFGNTNNTINLRVQNLAYQNHNTRVWGLFLKGIWHDALFPCKNTTMRCWLPEENMFIACFLTSPINVSMVHLTHVKQIIPWDVCLIVGSHDEDGCIYQVTNCKANVASIAIW